MSDKFAWSAGDVEWDDDGTELTRGARHLHLSAKTAGYSETPHILGPKPLWGKQGLKLPDYIENVAKGLQESGHPESEAIEIAIGTVKRWAAGGGKVTPEVRAASAKAVAEWEALKAAAGGGKSKGSEHVRSGQMSHLELVGPHGFVHGWVKVGPGGDAAKAAAAAKKPGGGDVAARRMQAAKLRAASGKGENAEVAALSPENRGKYESARRRGMNHKAALGASGASDQAEHYTAYRKFLTKGDAKPKPAPVKKVAPPPAAKPEAAPKAAATPKAPATDRFGNRLHPTAVPATSASARSTKDGLSAVSSSGRHVTITKQEKDAVKAAKLRPTQQAEYTKGRLLMGLSHSAALTRAKGMKAPGSAPVKR